MRKRGLFNLCAVAALATVTAGSLYSCKDYDDEMYDELHGQIVDQNSTLGDLITANEKGLSDLKSELEKTRTDLQKQLDDLKLEADGKYATKAELAAQVEILNKAIKNLDEALNKKVDDAVTRITELEKAKADALALIGELDKRVTVLEGKTTELGTTVEELKKIVSAFETSEDVKTLVQDVATTKAQAEANKALAEASQKLAQEGVDQANQNKEAVEKLEQRVAANEAELAKVDEKLAAMEEKLMNEVNSQIGKVTGDLNILDTKVSSLQSNFEKAQNELQKQIDELKTSVSTLQTDVANVKADLKVLGLKIDAVQNKVDNMVTSVLVNGAYSPVVGYFSLPTGVKSNILAAYYGSAETNDPMGLDFPSTEITDIVGAAKDNSALKFYSGNPIIANGFNAGKVYITVNPSSVNMEGKKFSLVNSVGDAAALELGEAKLSEDKLAFGYTRAGVNKNFYEVPARLNADQIANAKLRVEMTELKDAIRMVKDAVLNDASLDVTQLASTLFMCINDIADANAVKVSWNTQDGVNHDVMSDFGLAAVAVKPLSYEFMKDYEITNFWGIDKAYSLLDKIIAEANEMKKSLIDQFPNFDGIEVPEIKEIEVKPYDGKFVVEIDEVVEYHLVMDVKVSKTEVEIGQIKIPGNSYPVMSGKDTVGIVEVPDQYIDLKPVTVPEQIVHIDKVLQIPIKVTKDMTDQVKDLYEDMTGSIADVNVMIRDLKKFVEDLQPILDQLNSMSGNIESSLDKVIDKVNSKLTGLIGKVNNGLCKIVNNVNEALQPVMFAQAGDFVMVSRSQNAPSIYGNKFVLVPSSYTGEYLAPAAQKYVAVTNVIKGESNAANNAQCKTILENTNKNNADLNKVLDGANHAVAVENLEKGYTYEFTYSAVDFYGKVRNTKCYVAVK